jgi:hypothetical protein
VAEEKKTPEQIEAENKAATEATGKIRAETEALIRKVEAEKVSNKAAIEAIKARTHTTKELDAATERLYQTEKKKAELELSQDTTNAAAIKTLNEKVKKLDEHTQETEKNTKAQEKNTKAQNDFTTSLSNTIAALTGVTTGSETLVGSFFKLRKEVKEGKVKHEEFIETIDEMFDSLNVGASIMAKVQLSTVAMAAANDSAIASFNKATGAAGHYDSELNTLERQNRRLGISAAEMADEYSSLVSTMSGFGLMAESQRMELGTLGAQYGKVGVSASDFSGILQSSTNMMGLGTDGAMQMQSAAFDLAQELGRNVSEVFSELNQALPKLAMYSGDVTGMFVELEEQAHATGMAVGELMDIAGSYRTFDSAAEAAGNLNAVLGTQLFSTMGMLEAQLEGPAAVMEYMTDNLSNSIGDWNTLNTFEKEAVANAAKMSVEQLATLMNQRDMTAEQRREAASVEDAMKTARSMGDELKILFAEFAVSVKPIFDMLKGIVGFISSFLQKLHDTGGAVMQIGGMITLYLVGTFIKSIAKAAILRMTLGTQIPILSAISAKWTEINAKIATAAVTSKGVSGGGGLGGGVNSGAGGILPSVGRGGGLLKGAGKFLKSGMGMGMLATGLGMAVSHGAEENSGRAGLGGAIGGAGSGAMIGSMILPGVGTAVGAGLGALWGGAKGLGFFADGGGIAGTGPTPAVVHGGEAVVPIQRTPAAENLANMVAEKSSGGDNTAVVAAVQALGAKMDTMISKLGTGGDVVMQVNKREFGRIVNEHFGETGYQSVSVRTT